MREFAKVSPQIWMNDYGRKIKALGLEARVVSLYLNTNPYANMTGVYYMPVVLIAHEVGLSVDVATEALNALIDIGYCSYDRDYEYVWVHEMAAEQICPQLKPNDNRVKAINSIFAVLPKISFLQCFYNKYASAFHINNVHDLEEGFEESFKPLSSKEKKNDNENEKENENIPSGRPDIIFEESLLRDQSKEVLSFLNKKTGHNFRFEDLNLDLIESRLKSGASVDDCRAVIAMKYRDWIDTPMKKYLRPATLFNPEKFEQYIGECVVHDNESTSDEVGGEHEQPEK